MSFPLKTLVKELISKMASEEYQRHEWVNNVDKTWFIPDEIISEWFDDLRATSIENWKTEGPFSDKQLGSFRLVSSALNGFQIAYDRDKDRLGANLVDYEPWVLVRERANEALELLNLDEPTG